MLNKLLKTLPLWVVTVIVMSVGFIALVVMTLTAPWSIGVVLLGLLSWLCYDSLRDIRDRLQ